MEKLTNLYSLQKTLRFELKPVGKTLEHVEKNGLITEDEKRAEEYKKAKEIINRYHKWFIDDALNNVSLNLEDLERYVSLLEGGEDLEKIQAKLRKNIVALFKKHPKWKTLFKKELITKDLPEFLDKELNAAQTDEEKQTIEKEKNIIEHFKKFTTYFTGFHENRKNMYSDEAKHTAISYRIIHENLSVFLANIKLFNSIKDTYPDIIAQTQESISKDDGILGGVVVEDMFSLDYFPKTLSQTHIDLYNAMIGGMVDEDGQKIQGFNEKINLYRQKHRLDKRVLPNLKPLYKQILSDRASLSWLPDAFENDEELIEAIDQFYLDTVLEYECCDGKVNMLNALYGLFNDRASYDLDHVYIKNDRALSDISQNLFGQYDYIQEAIWSYELAENQKLARAKNIEDKKEKFFKAHKQFCISHINRALEYVKNENGQESLDIVAYYADKTAEYIDSIEAACDTWRKDKQSTDKTKEFLDRLLELQRALKGLYVEDADKDLAFYSYFDTYFDALSAIVPLYNKVRNYKSKKPYSQEKIKLNFQNSTLLDGWDKNKEEANLGMIFIRDGKYFLGIAKKGTYGKNFRNVHFIETGNEMYRKMEYKLLPGPNKMLPKVFFSQSRLNEFGASDELLNKYRAGYHKKGEKFDIKFCHELIDFYKNAIEKHPDWKEFNFCFKNTSSYQDISEFYKDVQEQGYKVSFVNLDTKFIDGLVEKGELYLFQIYNKDFSPSSKGTPNLHTLYWLALFNRDNLKDVKYALNGGAEIFYRKKSIEYDKEIIRKGHHYEKLHKKFNYPIVKDRRYAYDKFFLHVPISLNFKSENKTNISSYVNQYISSNADDIRIIGIDRGERHLLYLSLIDSKGKIIEQYSLNEIVNSYNGKEFRIDYHEKLTEKEKKRDEERKSWKSIENIKELKEGYLSQVIHKIATLILEHQAIVVLEDLNFGFKRGRFKVEKQVYQKFEKMLIDKLNYLVDKKRGWCEPAGVLNALQLTNKFTSFEKLGKQSGILFYVPAWNTSKMDPVTGFVNLFDTKYRSVEKSKKFFSKFRSIRYNEQKGYYEFEFDYNDFHTKAEGTKTKWTVCSYGKRIVNYRNQDKNNKWDWKEVDPTEELKKLFGNQEGELKDFIIAQNDKKFFEELLNTLRFILQIRNSATGTDIDYMVSPVADENGNFFDSRESDGSLPLDADANGAYNIARKGLMIVKKIAQAKDKSKVDLKITNKEWMAFAQGV